MSDRPQFHRPVTRQLSARRRVSLTALAMPVIQHYFTGSCGNAVATTVAPSFHATAVGSLLARPHRPPIPQMHAPERGGVQPECPRLTLRLDYFHGRTRLGHPFLAAEETRAQVQRRGAALDSVRELCGGDVSVSNSLLGSDWELHEVPAVGNPAYIVQIGRGHRVLSGEGQRRVALQ